MERVLASDMQRLDQKQGIKLCRERVSVIHGNKRIAVKHINHT
jgi:hypothetical protein